MGGDCLHSVHYWYKWRAQFLWQMFSTGDSSTVKTLAQFASVNCSLQAVPLPTFLPSTTTQVNINVPSSWDSRAYWWDFLRLVHVLVSLSASQVFSLLILSSPLSLYIMEYGLKPPGVSIVATVMIVYVCC